MLVGVGRSYGKCGRRVETECRGLGGPGMNWGREMESVDVGPDEV